MRCPRCETQWPDELAGLLRFCGACGGAMAEGAPSPVVPERSERTDRTERHPGRDPGGELRYVTVLFADLAGFTAFAEERPADDVANLVGDLLHRLGAIVEEHGGAVDKFLGDAVMATFGLPKPDPQAARNAVRAALAMREAARRWCEEKTLHFGLRVGIHAGEVMSRAMGSTWTVMGDTVNTASRIQSVAPPGKIWVSRPVHDEVRRYFTLHPHHAIELRGKKRMVQPYEVVGERASPQFSRPAFLGRERELDALTGTLDAAVAREELRVVIVRGEAGLGKSRLVRELRDGLERAPLLYRFDITQYDHSERLPAHGLNTLLRARFDLPLELGEEQVIAQVRARLGEVDPYAGPHAAELFAFVLGILRDDFAIRQLDGRGKWEGAFVEVKRWLEGWARKAPWVWVLEDTQKGDADTAAFLDWALRVRWAAPVLVIVTLREEDFGEDSHWYHPVAGWLQAGLAREIRLRELPPAVLAQALASMDEDAPLALTRRIAEHTEGNPLFAIELLRLLKDEGDGGDASLSVLPATIREVMEARIERLGPLGKEVAKRGALMGRRFTRDALTRIWDGRLDELNEGLQVLRDTETVYAEVSKLFSGEIEEVFRHGRLHEAALRRIPREDRLRWLDGLEAWARGKLELVGEAWEGAAAVLVPIIARSREEHGDVVEASHYWELLGLVHHRHARVREAIDAFRHALAHARGTRWYTLAALIVEQAQAAGQATRAIDALGPPRAGDPGVVPAAIVPRKGKLVTDLLLRWETLPESAAAVNLAIGRAHALGFAGHNNEASEVYRDARRRLEEVTGEPRRVLLVRWARHFMWHLSERLGNPREARELAAKLRRDVDLDTLPCVDERRLFLRTEGSAAWRMGQYDRALDSVREEVALFREFGGPGEEALWNFKGNVHAGLGYAREACQAYERSLEIAQAAGNRRAEAIARHNIGESAVTMGDWERGRREFELYADLSRAIGNRMAEFYAPLGLSNLAAGVEKYDDAYARIATAMEVARQNGWKTLHAMGRAQVGEILLLRWLGGAPGALLAEARAQLDGGLAELEAGGMVGEAGEHFAFLALAAHFAGDAEGARAAVERARRSTPEANLLARVWLDAVEAVLEGEPPAAALAWFREHDQERARLMLERVIVCDSARVGRPQAGLK